MKLISYNHFNTDPFFNMAFDEWMFQKVIDTQSLICIRLYSWKVGTITFGYNQQERKAFDKGKIGTTPVIRRVTGGRGLFHDESELTYSIAVSSDLSQNGVLSNSISKASAEIAEILVSFLETLNISSDYVRQSSKKENEKEFFHSAPCFASFSKNEIVSHNKKIIASAQRRISGALLQHGSIKINGIKQHDALPIEDAKAMRTSKMGELDVETFDRIFPLFVNSFSSYFSIPATDGILTSIEKKDNKNREKYVIENSREKRNFIKQI